jgi:hypothetical protein
MYVLLVLYAARISEITKLKQSSTPKLVNKVLPRFYAQS